MATPKIKNKQLIITSDFDINNQKLINISNPTELNDAVNKDYVDTNAINYSLGSGLYSGGMISIVDATHFSIASGVGYIVNSISKHSDKIEFDGNSAVTLMTMGATDITVSVAIDINGDVIQQIVLFNSSQRRNYIVLGEVYRDPLTLSLNAVWFRPVFSWDTSNYVDSEYIIGAKSFSGNSISANGSNLMLDITSGVIQGYSINAIRSYENPNFSSFTGDTAFNFIRSYNNGSEWVFQTMINQIEPQYYSNGTTTLQNVPNNKWSVRILGRGAITGRMYLVYPTQTDVYADSNAAKANLQNLTTILPEEFNKLVVPLVYLIVRGAATNLSSSSDAIFVPIQAMTYVAGGSTLVLANDVVYDNSGTTLVSVTVQGAINEISQKLDNLNYSIVNKTMSALSGTSGTYLACSTAINKTPCTLVKVTVNSLDVDLGDGIKTTDCYFSSDGGTTAKTYTNISVGDLLYWNGGVAPYQLELTDKIGFEYLTFEI